MRTTITQATLRRQSNSFNSCGKRRDCPNSINQCACLQRKSCCSSECVLKVYFTLLLARFTNRNSSASQFRYPPNDLSNKTPLFTAVKIERTFAVPRSPTTRTMSPGFSFIAPRLFPFAVGQCVRMRQDSDVLYSVFTLRLSQSAPEETHCFIASFSVVIGFHLKVPMEWRPEPVYE